MLVPEDSDPKDSAGTAALRRLERRRCAVLIQRADARTRLCQSLGPQTRPAVRPSPCVHRASSRGRGLRARHAFADTVGVQVAPGAAVGLATGAEWREVLLRRRVAAPDFLTSAGVSGTALAVPSRVLPRAALPLLRATAPARVGVEESDNLGGAPGLLQRLRVGAEPRAEPDEQHTLNGLCWQRPALLQLGGATRTLDRAVFHRMRCEDDACERAAAVVIGSVRRLLALRGEWHAHLRRRRGTAPWCSPSQGAWEMHGEAVSRGVLPILTVTAFGIAADGAAQVLQRWARSIARSQRQRERRAATTIQLLVRRAAAKLAARTRHAARTQILAAQCLQRAWQCREARRGAASMRAQQSRAPGPRTGPRPHAGLAVEHQVRVARQTVLLLQGASDEVLAELAPWQSHARGADRGGADEMGVLDSGGQVLRSHTATGLSAASDPGNATYCLNLWVPDAARPGFLQVPAADGDRGGRADTGDGGSGGRGMEEPGDESTDDARGALGDGCGGEWDVRRGMDSQHARREEGRGMGEVRRLMEETDELLDAVMVSQARLERDIVLGIRVEQLLDARHRAYQRKDSRLKDAMRATEAAAQGVEEGGVRGEAGGGGDVLAQDGPQARTRTRRQTHANTHVGSQQTRSGGSSRGGKTFTPPPSHSVPSSSTPLGEAEVEALCARRRRGDAAEERALRDAISSLASLLGARRRYVGAVGTPAARVDVDMCIESESVIQRRFTRPPTKSK
jgi:hypothetical protein